MDLLRPFNAEFHGEIRVQKIPRVGFEERRAWLVIQGHAKGAQVRCGE